VVILIPQSREKDLSLPLASHKRLNMIARNHFKNDAVMLSEAKHLGFSVGASSQMRSEILRFAQNDIMRLLFAAIVSSLLQYLRCCFGG
jgi:hypothetical protein